LTAGFVARRRGYELASDLYIQSGRNPSIRYAILVVDEPKYVVRTGAATGLRCQSLGKAPFRAGGQAFGTVEVYEYEPRVPK